MRYYLIAGEASGDLHASHLMASLKREDPGADFRFIGGDKMTAVGGTRLRHFQKIAYMGFVSVATHLPTILSARKQCKRDILRWMPDAVILVDYAGFNLSIAKFIKTSTAFSRRPAVYYYISPKIWAWKEGRIKLFRLYVDEMFCILPFEKDFFERKHHYPVHYVGNPTRAEVGEFRKYYNENSQHFRTSHGLDNRPIIALLAGSRRQEIRENLPMMLAVARRFPDYQFVVACVTTVEPSLYDTLLQGSGIKKVTDATYRLLSHATAALVTSGTATLETCLFDVPQVVLYRTPLPRLARLVWDHFFKVKYISLVNLIAGKEVVAEMMAEKFSVEKIYTELERILPGKQERQSMLAGYADVRAKLGTAIAPDNAAKIMCGSLSRQQ